MGKNKLAHTCIVKNFSKDTGGASGRRSSELTYSLILISSLTREMSPLIAAGKISSTINREVDRDANENEGECRND